MVGNITFLMIFAVFDPLPLTAVFSINMVVYVAKMVRVYAALCRI